MDPVGEQETEDDRLLVDLTPETVSSATEDAGGGGTGVRRGPRRGDGYLISGSRTGDTVKTGA